MRLFLVTLLALSPIGAILAQDDLRDVVTLHDGKEVRGRIVTPFAPEQLLVAQGGKRVRVARKDVASIDRVTDRVKQFLDLRNRQKDSARAGWILVEWAQAHGLNDLARLQAMHLVLQDDTNERAHEFLGHKRANKNWLWELDGKWLTRAQLEAQLPKKQLELTGEHFQLRLDGGIAAGIDALLDLERLYVWWFDEFGDALQLQESLRPLAVQTWRNAEGFPKWGFRPLAYFVPEPNGDLARTFYDKDPGRPQLLFCVGMQTLLYHTLAIDARMLNDRDRICPWLEVGLGMVAENTLRGPPGFAVPGEFKVKDLQAMQALGRTFRLTHLLHLPMYGSFYMLDDTPTAINWNAAATFTGFLLDKDNKPATREAFLEFIRKAIGERKGDSSSLFDQTLGNRVEAFEEPFRVFLEKKAGF